MTREEIEQAYPTGDGWRYEREFLADIGGKWIPSGDRNVVLGYIFERSGTRPMRYRVTGRRQSQRPPRQKMDGYVHTFAPDSECGQCMAPVGRNRATILCGQTLCPACVKKQFNQE